MNFWPVIENSFIKLEPLTLNDVDVLTSIASEKDLLQYSPSRIESPSLLQEYIHAAVMARENKTAIPFKIYSKKHKKYIGSTRFGLINPTHSLMHIGWTWIGKYYQGTGHNTSVKFLMLHYAFEVLKFEKIEFRIDELNIRSRKAVEKIGGVLEGILRNDTLMHNGVRRSSCCYGILKREWPLLRETLFKDLNYD